MKKPIPPVSNHWQFLSVRGGFYQWRIRRPPPWSSSSPYPGVPSLGLMARYVDCPLRSSTNLWRYLPGRTCFLNIGSITELAIRIISPCPQCSICFNGKTVRWPGINFCPLVAAPIWTGAVLSTNVPSPTVPFAFCPHAHSVSIRFCSQNTNPPAATVSGWVADAWSDSSLSLVVPSPIWVLLYSDPKSTNFHQS